MLIDLTKFILNCSNDDCTENEAELCCVQCDSYQDCFARGLTCEYLDDNGNSPEGCPDLILTPRKEG